MLGHLRPLPTVRCGPTYQMVHDHIATLSATEVYHPGSRWYSHHTRDMWRLPTMLAVPPPKAISAHKWCRQIPLTALPLTPPADIIAMSPPHKHPVPLHHDKTSHPDDVIQPKSTEKPHESQVFVKKSWKYHFLRFSFVLLYEIVACKLRPSNCSRIQSSTWPKKVQHPTLQLVG